MAFDPGTNSWGFSWGSGNRGGWGGSAQRRGPNVRVPQMMGGRLGTQPGYTAMDPTGASLHSAFAAAKADEYQKGLDMWQQGLDERMMGLQHKYRMDELGANNDLQRQMAMMQMFAQGMALPTGEQIERSRGDLSTSLADFARMRDQGRYSQGEMDTLSQDAWNKINQGSMQQAQDFNNQMASSGVYASPGASAALRMAGQFGANAQRGAVQANLLRENKEAMERGTMGYADISSQLADFASRPVNRMANFNPFTGEGMPPEWGMDEPGKRKKQKPQEGWRMGNSRPWQPQVAGAGY